MFDNLQTRSVLVFQVGITFVGVILEVVLPFVDSGSFVKCALVLLGRKQGVNDGLALGGCSG